MNDPHLPKFDETTIRQLIKSASVLAENYSNEYITIEHLLLVSLENDYIQNIFSYLEIDLKQIQIELYDHFRRESNTTLDTSYETNGYNLENANTHRAKPQQTVYFLNFLQNLVSTIFRSGKTTLTQVDIILEILKSEDQTLAKKILEQNGLTFDMFKAAVNYSNIPNNKTQENNYINPVNDSRLYRTNVGNTVNLYDQYNTPKNIKIKLKQSYEIIEKFTTNLNKLVEIGKIEPLIGRDDEIFKISKILSRKHKNNIILVGPAGVGKTAIAEGLAHRIVNKEISNELLNTEIYSLEISSLLAGTRFRGDLEERLNDLIKAFIYISENSDIKIIFFIDEIHSIIGAGAGSDNKALDISNLLKPALQKGTIKAIGSTTHEEYRKYIDKDSAFKRRFTKILVDEPSVEETILILKGLKNYYENFHKVKYTDEALEEAVYLSNKYITDNHFPDKAIDIIDNVGAKNKIVPEANRLSVITKKEIIEEIAFLVNMPISKLIDTENENIKNLELNLKSNIFGQNEAIEELISSVFISRAGMRDYTKPEGCYLFNGPTGVGKTELAKTLAKELGMSFVRIDMSEYMEKHAVSRLIGAPPGYVGYDDNGGVLLSSLDKNKNSIILFDEIEKAHPDIFNILLQIMDYGKITNAQGKSVYFNNSIIILTGNIGSSKANRLPMGFTKNINNTEQQEEVRKLFSPEFLNRLDGIITFNKLNKEICLLILNKFINNLNSQLSSKNIEIILSKKAIDELLKQGFDEVFGARPLSRIIDNHIKKKIAPEILFGRLSNNAGGTVLFDFVENEFIMKISITNLIKK